MKTTSHYAMPSRLQDFPDDGMYSDEENDEAAREKEF